MRHRSGLVDPLNSEGPAQQPALPLFLLLGGGGLIQNSAQLALFLLSQRRGSRSLRLQKRPEKDAVVYFGTSAAQISVVQLIAHSLGLKDLGLALATTFAQHHRV